MIKSNGIFKQLSLITAMKIRYVPIYTLAHWVVQFFSRSYRLCSFEDTMNWFYKFHLIIWLVDIMKFGNCARILSICPRASISHQIVFRGFTLALHEQGHELVVVTTDPMNNKTMKNYREIDISFLYNISSVSILEIKDWVESAKSSLFDRLNMQTDEIFNYPELKALYAPNSDEKFDLILAEILFWPSLLYFAKRFDAPIIGLSPMGLALNVQYALGNPILPSHPSNWELYTSIDQSYTFWQRVNNFITYWNYMHHFETVFAPQQEAIAKKYFGNDVPDISELGKNVSLVFVNQQMPISYVRPNVPKIIEINSLHVTWDVPPLPENLQKLLDGAKEGFVYMSLGSNMKSTMLPGKTLDEIILAFSKLPYQVLWKFEDDHLPNKPKNVHIMKWVPQRAVLAHPNLKVFLYQGGLQSTEEAISYAVPLIGFPTWTDQRMQVNKLVSLGVARKLDIAVLNSEDMLEAIHQATSDKSYKENMLNLRILMRENSEKLLKNAIWWTEHVIRHKGASYLHSSTADEPWYQRQDMDLIAFLSVGSMIILSLLILFIYKLLVISIRLGNKFSIHMKKNV